MNVDSSKGHTEIVAFAMGTTMGGRRPRTLTAILLRHCVSTASVTNIHGVDVLVLAICITFASCSVSLAA